MRRRSRVAVLLAVLVVAGGAATAVVLLAREPARPEPVSAAEAAPAARASCDAMTTFEQLVTANADLDRVRDALGTAERQAERAARGDATYLALAGGVQSVRLALDADDARAARVGIDVVRAECRRLSA